MDLTGTRISNRYLVQHRIAESGRSRVYRALDQRMKKPVAVKAIKPHAISHRSMDLVRFSSIVDAVSEIKNPHIVKVFETGTLDPGDGMPLYYVVMDLVEGISLDTVLDARTTLPSPAVALMAVQVCGALFDAHGRGIIHGGLKPGNILLAGGNPEIPDIRITDFGMYRLAGIGDPEGESIPDAFQYMSPEQSGVIRHAMDWRSDLYSLGVILYRALAGRLPFGGSTLMELMHNQITRIPEFPPEAGQVPRELCGVVMKLLEKDPEKRYRSAAGPAADLERFLRGERGYRAGEDDEPAKMDFRTGIIGRREELSRLDAMYRSAVSDGGRMCLITGEAGIGKTRLVEEFIRRLPLPEACVVEGKSSAGANRSPYWPFKLAFQSYTRRFFKYTVDRKKSVRERLKRAAGEQVAEMVRIIPILGDILGGRSGPPASVEDESRRIHFYSSVAGLFADMARIEKGMVIILEDLHWSDEGSMMMLDVLIRKIINAPVLIVGTCREEEIGASRYLKSMLEEAGRAASQIERIGLRPFTGGEMGEYVSAFIQRTDEASKELSRFVARKSEGNPFFAQEIMKSLMGSGIVRHDHGGWRIDRDALGSVEIPPTLLDMLCRRVAGLSGEDATVMSHASAIGKSFDFGLLIRLDPLRASARGDGGAVLEGAKAVLAAITRAVNTHLLVEDPAEGNRLSFAHERIREAFYRRLRRDQRRRLHRRIAETIEDIYGEKSREHLFDLAHHYIESGETGKIHEYAYPAAVEARRIYAHELAIRYFTLVKGMLDKGDDSHGAFWIDCAENLAATYLAVGKSDEARSLYMEVLPHCTGEVRKAYIYKQLLQSEFKKGNLANCERYGREGLALLGELLPVTRFRTLADIAMGLCMHKISRFIPAGVVRMRNRFNREESSLIVWFYHWLCWVYYLGDHVKKYRCIVRMLNVSESRIGKSRELAASLAYYAAVCAAGRKMGEASQSLRRSYLLRNEFSDKWGIAQCCQFSGFLACISGDYKNAVEWLERSIGLYSEIGDSGELAKATFWLFMSHYYMGDYRRANYIYERGRSAEELASLVFSSFGYPALYHIESGDYRAAERGLAENRAVFAGRGYHFPLYLSLLYMGHLYAEAGRGREALKDLDEARALERRYRFPRHFTAFWYVCRAAALHTHYMNEHSLMSRLEKRAALGTMGRACRAAVEKTKPWPGHHGAALRAAAKFYALDKNPRRAGEYFRRSVEHNSRIGRRYEEARARSEYGEFLRGSGRMSEALAQLEAAARMFDDMGLAERSRRIALMLGPPADGESDIRRLTSAERLKHVIAFGAEINEGETLDEILMKILSKAVEVTGARRGFIFLGSPGDAELRAALAVDESDRHEFSREIVERVHRSGRTLCVENACADGRYAKLHGVADHGLKSILCVPIRYRRRVTGVCCLDNALAGGVFGREDADIIEKFLSGAAAMVENAGLEERLSRLAAASAQTDISEAAGKKIEAIKKYLEENYESDISREKLAKTLGVNTDYLGKRFKAYTGRTIHEYVNEIRVAEAERMLRETDMKIIDIAYAVGFESLRTFNREFHRVTGEKPSRSREPRRLRRA